MNTLTGYSKSTLSDLYALTAAGGHIAIGNSSGNIPLSNGTICTNLNADKIDGKNATDFLLYYEKNYGATITNAKDIDTTLTSGLARVHISNVEYSSVLTGYDFNNKYWLLRFRPSYNDGIYYRSNGLGSDWKKLAFFSEIPTKISQLTNDSGYLTSRGYIGTTSVLSTSATLNLTGIGTISMGNKISSSSTSFLINADGSKELFYYNASGPYLSIGYGSAGAGYPTYIHGNKVQLRYGQSASNGAVLDSTGNFGIGTTEPTHKLHVKGSTRLEGNNSILSFSPDYTDTWSDGTNSHPWYGYDHRYAATGVYSTTISDYFGLTLKTSSGNISMTAGGNVGIGTYDPKAKLHVEGGITMTGTLLLLIHNIKSAKYTWSLTSGQWYRIMVSDHTSVQDATGELVIYLHNAGSPSTLKLSFGLSYHNYPFLFCNWATAWSGTSITKARIVYKTSYGNLKAYLEVYANQTMSHETTFSFLGTGWSFMAPTATTEAYTESLNSKCEISITSGTTRFSNDVYAPNFIGTVAWSNISGKPNIPNPTSYYWANVGVSSTSSNTTAPIFGNVRIGGTKTLSSVWKNGLVVGPDGYDKVVMTYLDSSTDGATIGAHNSDLSDWSVLNVSGSSIYFRSKEAIKMTMTSEGSLGIGTTAPNYKLDVSGGGRFTYTLGNYYRYAHWGGNLSHASGNAWYNVYSSTVNTAGDNIILKLSHSYYYTQTDSVIFAINVGYGTGSITQLNSTGGSKIFKKVRVRFVSNATVYVDVQIYSNVANTDSIYVTGTGSGTFKVPTATSDTTGTIKEIDVFYSGLYATDAKIDTLNSGTPITSANIGSQSVSNADTTDGVHLEWSGSQAASSTTWLAGWTSDGTKLKAVKRADLSVNYASSAGNADTVDNCNASYFGYNKTSSNYDCDTVGTHFAAYRMGGAPTHAFPSSAYGNMLVIGADGDTSTQIGCPYSADEMYFRRGTWYADGSGSIKNNTWKKILHSDNSSVSGGGSSWGSSISVKIGGTTATLTIPSNPNTWRGITNTYTGSDLTISVSQYGTNALYNALLNGYASSAGNADTVDDCHKNDFVRRTETLGSISKFVLEDIPKGVTQVGSIGWTDYLNHPHAGGLWLTLRGTSSLRTALILFPSYSMSSPPILYSSIDGGAWQGGYLLAYTGHTHSYLPLTGGTIKDGSTTGPFNINTDSTTEVGMRFLMSGSNKSWVGYHPTYGSIFYNYASGKYAGLNNSGKLHVNGTEVSMSGHTHSYLPLSGGTVTGTLQIRRDAAAILYCTSGGTVQGWLGFSAADTPSVWMANGSTRYNLYHTGNLSVPSFAAKGSSTKGVYLSSTNTFAEMSYYLRATVETGTANKLAYYIGANLIGSYNTTVGSSVLPIYMNAGVPTACDVPMVRYWARYTVSMYSGTGAYTKYSGNHNFITAISTNTTGKVSLTVACPTGWTLYKTMIFGNGFCTVSGSNSAPDTTVYPTIWITSDVLNGTVVLHMSDDASRNNGVCWLLFLCIG